MARHAGQRRGRDAFAPAPPTPFDKFQAWAATVPHTLRNPLYHWTHLELKRYFGIDDLLNEKSAEQIWKQANEKLATPELTTQGILQKVQRRRRLHDRRSDR